MKNGIFKRRWDSYSLLPKILGKYYTQPVLFLKPLFAYPDRQVHLTPCWISEVC